MKRNLLIPLFLLASFVLKAQSNSVGSGIALNFTGSSNSYVDLGDVYNDLNFPYSFEAWIKPEGLPPIWAGLFTTDNSLDLYYGSYIRISSSGQVEIEFGDGIGNGIDDRRGVITVDPLVLHQWTHVAVVANSVDDLSIYFNGVKVATNSTDGGSGSTEFTHSSAPASIGRMIDIYAEHDYNGEMDEVRLWNTSRTEEQIRTDMCHKLSGTETGLIGYWQADESYSGNMLSDKTVPHEDGTLMGSTTKVTSGAPVGDASAFTYNSNVYDTSAWDGVYTIVRSPERDGFKVSNVTGNPFGVQIYRVDAAPYSADGLNDYPNFYFGVFTANNGGDASYSCAYHYTFYDGVADSNNEPNLALYNRADATRSTWSDLNALKPDNLQRLEKIRMTGQNEFILNVNKKGALAASVNNVNSKNIGVYPNPFSDQLTIQNVDPSWKSLVITDYLGRMVLAINPQAAGSSVSVSTGNWQPGVYFVVANTGDKILSQSIISEK